MNNINNPSNTTPISLESILARGKDLDALAKESWNLIFERQGFSAKDGDRCVIRRGLEKLFPFIPSGYSAQIVVSDTVPEGTAAIFMKKLEPFRATGLMEDRTMAEEIHEDGTIYDRVQKRVEREAMRCRDHSPARRTLAWVLDIMREEQAKGEKS